MNFPVPWRCLLPSEAVDFVTYNNGALIRELSDKTGAGIDISSERDTPRRLSDRIVTISGQAPQKEMACRGIVDRLRRLQDLQDVSEPGFFVIIVPAGAVPVIVGAKGVTINEVLANSGGVDLSIGRENVMGMPDTPIGLEGTAAQVVAACACIHKVVQDMADRGRLMAADFKYRPDRAEAALAAGAGMGLHHVSLPPKELDTYGGMDPTQNFRTKAKLVVDTGTAGWLIGRSGRHIREMQENSGAFLHILREEELPPMLRPGDRVVEVCGRYERKLEGLQVVMRTADTMPNNPAPRESRILVPTVLAVREVFDAVVAATGGTVVIETMPDGVGEEETVVLIAGTISGRVQAAQDFLTRTDKAHIDGIVVAKSVDGEIVGKDGRPRREIREGLIKPGQFGPGAVVPPAPTRRPPTTPEEEELLAQERQQWEKRTREWKEQEAREQEKLERDRREREYVELLDKQKLEAERRLRREEEWKKSEEQLRKQIEGGWEAPPVAAPQPADETERARMDRERIQERIRKEQAERDRNINQQLENQRAEQDKAEQLRLEREKLERQRQERLARDQALDEQERAARERAERARAATASLPQRPERGGTLEEFRRSEPLQQPTSAGNRENEQPSAPSSRGVPLQQADLALPFWDTFSENRHKARLEPRLRVEPTRREEAPQTALPELSGAAHSEQHAPSSLGFAASQPSLRSEQPPNRRDGSQFREREEAAESGPRPAQQQLRAEPKAVRWEASDSDDDKAPASEPPCAGTAGESFEGHVLERPDDEHRQELMMAGAAAAAAAAAQAPRVEALLLSSSPVGNAPSMLVLLVHERLLLKGLVPSGHMQEVARRCQVHIDVADEQECPPQWRQVTLLGTVATNAAAAYWLQVGAARWSHAV